MFTVQEDLFRADGDWVGFCSGHILGRVFTVQEDLFRADGEGWVGFWAHFGGSVHCSGGPF